MKRTSPPWPDWLSSDQAETLAAYEALLLERAGDLGLVSRRDLPRLRERHLLDSLRAARAFVPEDRLAYDLGSGAGLPGIVLAVAVPHCRFVLVEPRHRRAGFLELVVERLSLTNAEVLAARAEDVQEPGDVVTSRAFAPLDRAWRAAVPMLRPGGRLVFFAGGAWGEEAEALTDPERPASIEKLESLANLPPVVIIARG